MDEKLKERVISVVRQAVRDARSGDFKLEAAAVLEELNVGTSTLESAVVEKALEAGFAGVGSTTVVPGADLRASVQTSTAAAETKAYRRANTGKRDEGDGE